MTYEGIKTTRPVVENLEIFDAPAACPQEIIKAKVAVMKAVHGVGQTGRNKFHNYDYASSADVLKAVREAMVENGLTLEMWPTETIRDEDGNMQVRFLMQWQHESGSVSPVIPWYGVANDRDGKGKVGDKWFNKCATAAEKYFFLKQFHIPSEKGFDPDEGNAATDKDQPQGKPAAKRVTPKKEDKPDPDVEAIKEESTTLFKALEASPHLTGFNATLKAAYEDGRVDRIRGLSDAWAKRFDEKVEEIRAALTGDVEDEPANPLAAG